MVGAIVTFVTTIKTAVVAAGTLRAAMLAVVAASGGILPLVAGVATLTVALGSMAMASSRAAARQKLLAETIKASAKAAADFKNQKFAKALKDVAGSTAYKTLRVQLDAQDKLTHSLERNLYALENLSEKEKKAKILKGELFSVVLDGTTTLVDHKTALQLANTEMGERNNIQGQLKQTEADLAADRAQYGTQLQDNIRALKHAKFYLKQYDDGKRFHMSTVYKVKQAIEKFDAGLAANIDSTGLSLIHI